MTFGDLFAGIGGFRLGLERAGHVCKWACEIDPYRRAVYALNFGHEPQYRDIRECIDPPHVDLITGGFPCQPFSLAGKQRGAADQRNLWPEMLRVIGAVRPMWVLGENVLGIANYFDGTVRPDLETRGYEVLPLEIPAAAFGAPHLRNRLWIVAHAVGERSVAGAERIRREARTDSGRCSAGANVADAPSPRYCERGREPSRSPRNETRRERLDRLGSNVADTNSIGREGDRSTRQQEPGTRSEDAEPTGLYRPNWQAGWWSTEPDVGRVAHGIPHRVDRLKALGDAVVPQVVQWIGERLMELEKGWIP